VYYKYHGRSCAWFGIITIPSPVFFSAILSGLAVHTSPAKLPSLEVESCKRVEATVLNARRGPLAVGFRRKIG